MRNFISYFSFLFQFLNYILSETDEATLAWLAEVPAELDVCLAHKDLDQVCIYVDRLLKICLEAVDLIREWKEYRGKDAAVDTQMVLRENQVEILIYVVQKKAY